MGLFRTRPSPAEIALSALQAENSDLRTQLRLERAQFETERLQLIEHILALAKPVVQEVRRTPLGEAPSPAKRPQIQMPPYPPLFKTAASPPESN
jgi:hypothetical protein